MSDEHNSSLESRISSTLQTQIDNILFLSLTFEGSCTQGAKVTITIVSNIFSGMKPLARHKLVNKAVDDFLVTGELHAVTIKAMDEAGYEKSKPAE